MADNKKYIKNTICTLIVMMAAFAFFSTSVCAEEGDWVEIVSVTPNSYDNYTGSVTFTATVNYSLQSAEQGIVYLGFNTGQPNYYEIDTEPGPAGVVVSRGMGTVVLSKTVTPANWDTAISRMQQYMQGISYPVTDFKIYSNLSEYPHDIPWTPLAVYEAVLTDLPETELGTDEVSVEKEIEEFHPCGNNLTWKLEDGMLTIEGIGDMADFNPYNYSSTPAPPWMESRSDITKVVIGSGVTSIGTYAFWCCDNLISVDIPNSVISIGDNAFWACKSLASISIPNSVTNIGMYAFQACGFSTVTVPSGVTSISKGMFMECENLSSVIFMEGVARIELAPFEYCLSLQSLTIPKSVTYIDGRSLGHCPDLGDIYYGGSEEDWKKINTSLDMEGMYWYVKIHYNAISGEGAALPEMKAEYKVYCGEGYPNGYEIFDCSLEDCLSKTDSDKYNPQLAHMLIAMCNSVYNGTNIEETFNSFGFKSEDTDKSYDMERMLLAYGMAKKQIIRACNEKTLVLIVARGTLEPSEDLEEWKSNIDILTTDKNQHEGFAEAANALYDRMIGEEFLGTSDFSNMEFVITGFSRGAGAANILAARLVDEGVAQSCIHAYAFACPDTVKASNRTAGRYGCIFNIANVQDFVSWVPETLLGDRWNKYGQSYWYCEDRIDHQSIKMGTIFDNPDHNQMLYLTYLRNEKSDYEYWDREQARTALDAADEQRRKNIVKSLLYVRGYRKEKVPYSGVWCPVDVEIFTSDGRLVGRVVNDVAEIILDDKVYISVDGSRKHIYFRDEDTYSLQLTATDDGIMYYTVQSIDVETQETTEEKVFPAVVLTDGRQMTSSVAVGEDGDAGTGEVKLFVIGDGGVNIAEIQENGEEIPLPEMQGADGAESEDDREESKADGAESEDDREESKADGAESKADREERYTEKDTEGELSAEEKDIEDKPAPYTTGILNIIVFAAVVVVFILMGTVIILWILVKRRKYADAIRPDRAIPQEKPRFCHACGKSVGSTGAFCAYCGAKISGSMPHRPGI